MPRFGEAGEQVHYEVRGSGPPLLLLHGLATDGRVFETNQEGLAGSFTTITVDLPGHGQSDAPGRAEAYGPAALTARLTGLLDALGHERVLVAGHALGGMLGLHLACEMPERVAGVVLVNPRVAVGDGRMRAVMGTELYDFAQRVRSGGMDVLRGTRLNPERATRLPEPARRTLIRAFGQVSPTGVAHTIEALVPGLSTFDAERPPRRPVLVVMGEFDADLDESLFDFVAALPAETTNAVTLEDSGHGAHIEHPEAFEAVVTAFARGIGFLPGGGASNG